LTLVGLFIGFLFSLGFFFLPPFRNPYPLSFNGGNCLSRWRSRISFFVLVLRTSLIDARNQTGPTFPLSITSPLDMNSLFLSVPSGRFRRRHCLIPCPVRSLRLKKSCSLPTWLPSLSNLVLPILPLDFCPSPGVLFFCNAPSALSVTYVAYCPNRSTKLLGC